MAPKNPPGEPMTLGNRRQLRARNLDRGPANTRHILSKLWGTQEPNQHDHSEGLQRSNKGDYLLPW